MIKELGKLDQGFETVYDRVREELLRDKARYRMEIIRMKELVQILYMLPWSNSCRD